MNFLQTPLAVLKRYHNYFNFGYAFFLVFMTPIAIPLAVWTYGQGQVKWPDLLLAVLMYGVSGLGITVGYHRLATHRSFVAKPWLKRALLIAGTFAMQGGPANWASLHIQHHRFADKPGDPHSPQVRGFWHAHCGWLFHDYKPDFRRYGKWLLKDKEIRHVTQYYLLYSHLGLLLPFIWGGWVGLIWAGMLRLFLTSHVTWSINSVCHRWGSRVHSRNSDQSTNHFWIALLSFGEGWHHNHHRYLQMPFFGHHWYQIDMGKWLILFFNRLGWVSDLKIPSSLKKLAR